MESRVSSFANRLNMAMQNNNINQVQLSEKTRIFNRPISQSLINKYLKGKALPRQNNIYILAKILNVDEAWLMGFDISQEIILDELKDNDTNSKVVSIDIEGLDENDIEEINRFVEFIRSKKKKI